ncbi:MAG: hypothetical protein N3B10_00035 [Armatimonadetes bacterium]|nr:hypothetical protein [Armatimonadota bacterium]
MPKGKSEVAVNLPIDWNEFERKALERLKEIQSELLPEKAHFIVAIEPESGGYVVAETFAEAVEKFRSRFPDKLYFMVRADGGPVMRLRFK